MQSHQTALWAAVSAFFGSLLTIGAINLLNPEDFIRFAGAIVVAVITGGAVYAKQRLDEAKKTEYDGKMVVAVEGDKKVFSLELDSDPNNLDQKDKVVFKVVKAPSG
jgi:hypothetical protein